ncbi:hypothetical protein IWX90DRAFT_418155 [Phyllosticta citrichinensis]|uniref:Uncharacterized protein n=1 Tax=Phyllosticta citrichinensis TaxID=1130410 RepID=A0ABR1XI15_9PEZI
MGTRVPCGAVVACQTCGGMLNIPGICTGADTHDRCPTGTYPSVAESYPIMPPPSYAKHLSNVPLRDTVRNSRRKRVESELTKQKSELKASPQPQAPLSEAGAKCAQQSGVDRPRGTNFRESRVSPSSTPSPRAFFHVIPFWDDHERAHDVFEIYPDGKNGRNECSSSTNSWGQPYPRTRRSPSRLSAATYPKRGASGSLFIPNDPGMPRGRKTSSRAIHLVEPAFLGDLADHLSALHHCSGVDALKCSPHSRDFGLPVGKGNLHRPAGNLWSHCHSAAARTTLESSDWNC